MTEEQKEMLDILEGIVNKINENDKRIEKLDKKLDALKKHIEKANVQK